MTTLDSVLGKANTVLVGATFAFGGAMWIATLLAPGWYLENVKPQLSGLTLLPKLASKCA